MRNLGGLVVSNSGGHRGHQHQRVLHVPANLGTIDVNAFDHVLDVAVAGVRDQGDRMQEVVDDHRLEHVEFEVALRASESNRSGGAVNLSAHHGHGFALGGVHLAGHN